MMIKSLHLLVAVIAVGCVHATSATADVLEIDIDGNVILLAGRPAASPLRPAHPLRRAPPPLRAAFAQAGAEAEISTHLLEAVAWVESHYDGRAASPKGALGVMQLMPATARMLGVDARDPAQNIRGGAAYLRRLLRDFDGDTVRAVAAYNAGPAAVRRYGGVPPYPETRTYVERVMSRLAAEADQLP